MSVIKQVPSWEAARYALADPTLDRLAFEARMIDDVELALQVAEAVRQAELIQRSMTQLPLVLVPSTLVSEGEGSVLASRFGWHWTSIGGLAALLLVSIGLVNLRLTSISSPSSIASTKLIPEGNKAIADQWLAFRSEPITLEPINEAFVDEPRDMQGVNESDLEDEDWLLDAAREFYAEGVAS